MRPAEPAAAGPGRTAPSVSVIVTVLRDVRVRRTLESLLTQRRAPMEILVADGGPPGAVQEIAAEFHRRDSRVVHLPAPGNIPESRNIALEAARGELVAFLDADETAPEGWLEQLVAPFADPAVGFTGGPTPGEPGTTRTVGARFYDGYLRRFYETEARHHPHALPMGNSAWRAEVFRRVGRLDTTLFRRAASEDQEVALRALRAGYTGVYVPGAWVYHDFSELSVRTLLRKQRIYAQGGYVLWRREGSTYEARPGRLAPYVALPLVALVGGVMMLFPLTRLFGLGLFAVGAGGLGALAVALTVTGVQMDREFPGMRFRALEILRRWATLWGAGAGLLASGWSGRRGSPPAVEGSSGKP